MVCTKIVISTKFMGLCCSRQQYGKCFRDAEMLVSKGCERGGHGAKRCKFISYCVYIYIFLRKVQDVQMFLRPEFYY